MAWFLIPVALIAFHRELAYIFFALILKAKRAPEDRFDVRLTALKLPVPQVLLFEDGSFHCLVLSHWPRPTLFVHRHLWDRLSLQEREAVAAWTSSASLMSTNVSRLVGGFHPRGVDRDAALLEGGFTAFITALEKVMHFKIAQKTGTLSSLLEGLSLLGPSWLSDWPSVPERTQAVTNLLMKLGG